MSACQSQGSNAASSCASAAQLAPPATPIVLPEGVEALRISDSVVTKVAEMLAEEGDASLMLRIFVTGGGCSGFQYGFAFDDASKDDDIRVERGPIRIVVDSDEPAVPDGRRDRLRGQARRRALRHPQPQRRHHLRLRQFSFSGLGAGHGHQSVTPKAAHQIRKALQKRGGGVGLRVAVKTSGCSGYAYALEFADEMPSREDLAVRERRCASCWSTR